MTGSGATKAEYCSTDGLVDDICSKINEISNKQKMKNKCKYHEKKCICHYDKENKSCGPKEEGGVVLGGRLDVDCSEFGGSCMGDFSNCYSPYSREQILCVENGCEYVPPRTISMFLGNYTIASVCKDQTYYIDPLDNTFTSCSLFTICASLTKDECKSGELQILGSSPIQCKYKKGLCFKKKEKCKKDSNCVQFLDINQPRFVCGAKGYCLTINE